LIWRRPLDGLLVELGGAAGWRGQRWIEKQVADMEDQIDGANGVGVGGQALVVAVGLKVEHGGSGGKDPPVHGIAEGLCFWGKLNPGRGGAKRAHLLGSRSGGQGKNTKNGCGGGCGSSP